MAEAQLRLNGYPVAVAYNWRTNAEGSLRKWCTECAENEVLQVTVWEISHVTVRGKEANGGKYRKQAIMLVEESVGKRCATCQLKHGNFGWFALIKSLLN